MEREVIEEGVTEEKNDLECEEQTFHEKIEAQSCHSVPLALAMPARGR